MLGNTRAIGGDRRRAAGGNETAVVPHARERLAGADLVVVGEPTHIHRISGPDTRKGPIQIVGKAGSTVTLDAKACDPGLREWFASLAQ